MSFAYKRRTRETKDDQPIHSSLNQADWRMTLETIISLGVFGWMAVGMVLMGLGIW
jgi:hypothetical protein